jgi:Queuine/archaeosine tRNA-ribosyltransferase
MEELGCRILLGNTYHLAYKPGGELLEKFGGIRKPFMVNK